MHPSELNSCWIWDDSPPRAYNASRWFRKRWTPRGGTSRLAITADTRYRLWVNGTWVADGPARGWPEKYLADDLDITPHLRVGENEVLVLVHFFGCGNFHVIPQRGGLAALLREDGDPVWTTDADWEVSDAPEYVANAPRICVQLAQFEIYDARLAGLRNWRAARRLKGPVPWTLDRWRDVCFPQRQVVPVETPPRATKLEPRAPVWNFTTLRTLYPDVFSQASHMTRGFALAAEAVVTVAGPHPWFVGEDWEVHVNGEKIDPVTWNPSAGPCRIVAVYARLFDDRVDIAFGPPAGLTAPDGSDSPTWRLLAPEDIRFQGDDRYWFGHPSAYYDELETRWKEHKERWIAAGSEAETFGQWLNAEALALPHETLFTCDPDGDFRARQPVGPLEIAGGSGEWMVPFAPGYDIELHFDLGDQIAGFQTFEIDAPEGTIVDLALVEFLREDGTIQHTTGNRNGLRYIAREGRQEFLARQRRSGRHVFLTIRGATRPVHIARLAVIESRYPAEAPVPFACSDPELTDIWAAAHRTMQLSMDDVFIDSLYEQTLWVGDARVQQLYALRTYDARDISLRSMRLAAESASRAPMVLSQVPSCWENILPVWSFLWVVSVWDYYDYCAEEDVLREMWPAAKKTLRAAAYQLNERGLLEAPWWNLFEWAHVDNEQRTVLYVTQFLLGAVQAARKIEAVIGDPEMRGWLASLEQRLVHGINSLWSDGLYAESVHRDGSLSSRFSIHPQFLAALYGAANAERSRTLLDRIATDASLEGLASPFALQFYCEALEKHGREAEILALIRKYFAPMTKVGTTLWEALPGSRTSPAGFPTRSHCHGWSACPMDFLPRILLGVRPVGPGSRSFVIRPQPHGLSWARGRVATPHGPIDVEWSLADDILALGVRHPAECHITVEPPEGLEIRLDLLAERRPLED